MSMLPSCRLGGRWRGAGRSRLGAFSCNSGRRWVRYER
jgi:hypothetical protein